MEDEEYNNFGCPNTFMTGQDHKNLQFRVWAEQNGYNTSHRSGSDGNQPHYASSKTRIEYFNWMGDWHK